MTDNAELDRRIAGRVRTLRAARGWSLARLADRCGVSRSMISLIERGESSATAVVLERLATGLGVTLAALFDPPPPPPGGGGPLARRAEQSEWRDPGSGYVRRNLTPGGVPQVLRLVEVRFPSRARVAFDNDGQPGRRHQQVYVLHGTMDVTADGRRHRLHAGDCLWMTLDQPTMFHNPGRATARYLVAITDAFGGVA